MSLDTVLQIGKVLRHSDDNLKYFKYVEPCPKDKDGNWPICITIPVKEDFSFDWERMKITPPVKRDNHKYFNYKTSDNDRSPNKYLFGDIYYVGSDFNDNKILGVKGNYTLEKGNAFDNGLKPYNEIIDKYYFDYAYSLLNGIHDEKQKQKKIKEIIRDYKKVDIEKTTSIEQEKLLSEFNGLVRNNSLIRFHTAFKENLEKFNLIIKYAPVFDNVLSERTNNISTYLDNIEDIENKYIQIVFQESADKVKKQLFGKQNKDIVYSDLLNTIDNITKQKVLQYANFRVFIHFEFENGKQWYSIKDAFDLLVEKLNSEITRKTIYGLVPDAYIYRTLCSGNSKNDIQFPGFDINSSYKSFAFEDEIFNDFLYTSTILKKPFRTLYKTKISFFIFPIAIKGKIIDEKRYNAFFEKKNEDLLQNDEDPLLFSIEKEEPQSFNKFDFIFSDNGGQTTNDLVEISGLEQSELRSISKHILKFELEINNERKEAIQYEKKVGIENSFLNVLGTYQINKSGYLEVTENQRYASHLLKVLPLIYMRNYYNDAVILPAFNENIEKIIRMVKNSVSGYKYEQLKYDLKFLLSIQNNLNNKFMEITENSKSYQIGLGLGKLSKPLKKEIASFEKRYVGLLTRRTSTKTECIAFCNEIIGKLAMHDKTWGQLASETIEQLIEIPQNKYDKEEFALGFFEGYFHYEVSNEKDKLINRVEKIISDYEGKDNLQDEIQILSNALEEIK